MSLVEQSQQAFPTDVQVTVHQARNLRPKGKNGTNDAYAIIQVAKDKFSTLVAEKSTAPMWKEEATFGLPLFHPGNVDRCTLYITVMHRVQAGLDKFLGQAVVNLVQLYENKARQKPDWFPLVDKSGKADKLRGDVLLGITFTRNNMSASMVDLSVRDKPRSRMSKFKDKIRLKKKDSFSDSGSVISQVLTDSDGDHDSLSPNQTAGEKKKNKLKNLFAPKSNLERNTSQSMSTLGSLPRKNSSLSGSRSSGINVETPEVKKKFKFPGHKRSGSSDSKVSLGPLSSLLNRSKHTKIDQNNTGVISSHVNANEMDAGSDSTFSLNSSGQGSMENVEQQQHTASVGHSSVPLFRSETRDRLMMEQQYRQEEEERRQIEAIRLQEEEERLKKLQEEEISRQNEEYEKNRRFLDNEARREKQREDEEEERRRVEAAEDEERRKLDERTQKNEEQKSHEEASMSERLSSLFGITRRKEETPEEATTQDSRYDARDPQVFGATSLVENISLSTSTQFNSSESPAGEQNSSLNPQTSSATYFLNRTARVSTVKPRLSHSLESESSEHLQFEHSEPQLASVPVDQQWSSPGASESTPSSVPYDSPDTFSYLHTSLAPLRLRETPPGSPCESPPGSPLKIPTDSLCERSTGSPSNSTDLSYSPTMADWIGRSPLPPLYPIYEAQSGGTQEVQSATHTNGSQQGKKLSLPLPDYETLYPQKRHGVTGTTRWDHIIAEVNQRQMDTTPELVGPEMSVDGPENFGEARPSFSEESPDVGYFQTHQQENRRRSSKNVAAPPPPNQVLTTHRRSISDSGRRESQDFRWSDESLTRSFSSATAGSESLQEISLDESRSALQPSFLPSRENRSTSQMDWDSGLPTEDTQLSETSDINIPTARPRKRAVINEPTEHYYSGATKAFSDMSDSIQTTPSFSMSEIDDSGKQDKENNSAFCPYTSTDLSRSMGAPEKPARTSEDLFSRVLQTEQKPKDLGMTADDLDQIFNEEKPVDPFARLNGYETSKMEDEFGEISPVFQRRSSSRRMSSPPSRSNSQKALKFQQESSDEEKSARTQRDDIIESIAQRHPADGKAQVHLFEGEDPFGSNPMEESSSKAEVVSVRKKPKRALMPPSESQFVSAQISNGDGLSSTLSRPHPVKPIHSIESQYHSGTSALKDVHVPNGTAGKVKVAGVADSGPFTQLTHEELITLVVRQQDDLSKKDCKISELEEYIDNLLVRVIEEKPAILQALNKPA